MHFQSSASLECFETFPTLPIYFRTVTGLKMILKYLERFKALKARLRT
jgi:hypothetical protein